MSTFRKVGTWTVGPYTFTQHESQAFGTTYTYEYDGSTSRMHYESLEETMAAAVAEPYVGSPGAGGSGVGSPDQWFMAMLRGAKQ